MKEFIPKMGGEEIHNGQRGYFKENNYEEINGNIFEGFENSGDYILHQTNCTILSKDCSGIAKSIFTLFPDAAIENDIVIHYNDPYIMLGDYSGCDMILNLYGQFYPGGPKRALDSFDCRISYLKEGFSKINKYYKENTIRIPLISSGLAADKDKKGKLTDKEYFDKYIKPIVIEFLPDINVKVYYL